MKRGATGLCGVLAIDKPQGVSSHDVVNAVRRLTGERRVGHAGTLDPMATGVLMVCVGAAARLSSYLTGHDKGYEARIVFCAATDTDDAEGRIVTAYTKTKPGEGLASLAGIDPQEQLNTLLGEQLQLPPAYSAIKKNGVTAYKAAREGKALELEPRKVLIRKAELVGTGFEEVDLDDGHGGRFKAMLPYWDVSLEVSKGTYIRSVARDLGQRLGCGAHLSALRRTKSGETSIASCITLEQLAKLLDEGASYPWVDPIVALGLPSLRLDEEQVKAVGNGRPFKAAQQGHEGLFACHDGVRLRAICAAKGGLFSPEAVFPNGVAGVVQACSDKGSWQWGDAWQGEKLECVVAMGVFDGLHLGHRALLSDAYKEAAKQGVCLSVLTFERDPDEIFNPQTENPGGFKLTTNKERITLLEGLEAELAAPAGAGDSADRQHVEVFAIPVTKDTLAQSPEAFLAYVASCFKVRAFFVGEGFRFGAKAAGTTETLGAWCAQKSARFCEHKLVADGEKTVSSTRIRAMLEQEGDAQGACHLRAGHMHRIAGHVVRGRGEGTGMGFATANLELKDADGGVLLPKEGVYAGYAAVRLSPLEDTCAPDARVMLPAAINLGKAKSFANAVAEVEVHVIGLAGDIYGSVLDVWFARRLRDQIAFESQDELIATVTHDIGWVKTNLDPLPAGSTIDPYALAEY